MTFTYVYLQAGDGYRDATGASPYIMIRARPLVEMTNGTKTITKEVVIPVNPNGVASRSLAATTDPDTSPTGNAYRIIVEAGGKIVRSFLAEIPHDAGSTVDIDDLTVMVSPPAMFGPTLVAASLVAIDGGVLYVDGGALKWQGAAGTVTTIAPS